MSWRYDEMRQTGVDFEDVEQVAAYDAKQGSSIEAERALIRRLGIEPGHIVVDLGCGTGSFARAAARHGARVRAIDVSRTMIDFVAQAARREGLAGLDVEHAGFLTFDARPHSVDFVITRFALHHLPDFWKQVALLRLHQVLKPGGHLYLRDVVFSFDAPAFESSIEGWIERMSVTSGFSRDEFETHVREEYSTWAWVMEGMLERAGFTVIDASHPSPEYAEYVCTAARRTACA